MALITGCGAAPVQKSDYFIYFPKPPDLPRIQFLTSFTSEKDLLPDESSFEKFVVGEKKDVKIDKPYGVALYGGKIYVCDTNVTVTVFDLVKKTMGPLAGAQGLGRLIQPLNIAIDKEGNKYVADTGRGQVVVFDRDDQFLNAIGTFGTWRPSDVDVFENLLYVADIKNGLIKVFDKASGAEVKEFGKSGKPQDNLYMPTNISFDREGNLYITDTGRFKVFKYDRDGHLLNTFGMLGSGPGTFARPKGIATDRNNRVYVVDASFANVQVFDQSGQLLLYFSKQGYYPGDLYLPAQVVVDYDHVQFFEKYAAPDFALEAIIVVTSQFDRRLVNVFGLGKMRNKEYPEDAELLKELKEKDRKLREEEMKNAPKGDGQDKK
ncbi:MAG: 6-bladed beta-propeller [Thermodesulfovibrionales bacterium]